MQEASWIALAVAVGSGLAIGVQVTLNDVGGKLLGAVGTGLLVNLAGGTLAGLLLLLFASRIPQLRWDTVRSASPIFIGAGAAGVLIIGGVAFAMPRTGIAAGLAAVLVGQFVVALLVDTFGLGSGNAVPLSTGRVLGLALLAAATWLLLPRQVPS